MRGDASELPDADGAVPPNYLLLAREWRTVAEYAAARRAVGMCRAGPEATGIRSWCCPVSGRRGVDAVPAPGAAQARVPRV